MNAGCESLVVSEHTMRAATEMFSVSESYKEDDVVTLQHERRRRFLQLQGTAKGILPCKMNATGDFLISRYYKGELILQNERRRLFFLHFQGTTKGNLRYKMSAAGEIFTVSGY